jgi:hypothetical protein
VNNLELEVPANNAIHARNFKLFISSDSCSLIKIFGGDRTTISGFDELLHASLTRSDIFVAAKQGHRSATNRTNPSCNTGADD